MEWEKTHQPCPCGISSDAYSVNTEGWGTCFSCNKKFPPKDLNWKVMAENNQQTDAEKVTYQYLPWRGVTAETMQVYRCQTKVVGDEPSSIGFFYSPEFTKVRSLKTKSFFAVGKAFPGLFGKLAMDGAPRRSLIITEGELDAMSAFQMSGYPAVSIQSASSAARDVKADYEWVNSFQTILLCMDADEPGLAAAQKIAPMFDFHKIKNVKLGEI